MTQTISFFAILFGATAFIVSNDEGRILLTALALGCGFVSAWTLANRSVLPTVYAPHRIGAWLVRLLWFAVAITIPFTDKTILQIRWVLCLISIPMAFSLLGRLYRLQQAEKLASISDLVAVYAQQHKKFCAVDIESRERVIGGRREKPYHLVATNELRLHRRRFGARDTPNLPQTLKRSKGKPNDRNRDW